MKFKLAMIELRHKAHAVRLLSAYPVLVLTYILCVHLLVLSTLGAELSGLTAWHRKPPRLWDDLKDITRDTLVGFKTITAEVQESWL